MPVPVDDLQGLADRPGWTVDADRGLAVFAPVEGGWSAKVRRVAGTRAPGYDRYDRWHVAIIDPAGVARQTKPWSYLSDARAFAEGRVNAENA